MKLWSDSWVNGERIPPQFAAGRRLGAEVGRSANLNPHLDWSEAPAGTRSYVLICHDFDVPSVATDVNRPDREVPADLPRVDFFHWVLVDLPETTAQIDEGAYSRGFTPRGKPGPRVALIDGVRQGVNDYTDWFAGDPALAGDYYGYDGPYPPVNDSLIHHYVYTLYAIAVARAPVDGRFTGATVRERIYPYILAEATLSGTYTLNPRLG